MVIISNVHNSPMNFPSMGSIPPGPLDITLAEMIQNCLIYMERQDVSDFLRGFFMIYVRGLKTMPADLRQQVIALLEFLDKLEHAAPQPAENTVKGRKRLK